ncbi:MAG: AraC family transcriptional regulator [Planctomycetota bacterium]
MADTFNKPSRARGHRSYRMEDFGWFRVAERVPGLPVPYYVGRGIATNASYNVVDVPQLDMPGHVVLKVALSAGGAWSPELAGPRRPLRPGDATFRLVQDGDGFWEGYHPSHRGEYHFLGFIFRGEAALASALGIMETYGHVFSIGTESLIVKRLLKLADRDDHVVDVSAGQAARLVSDVLLTLVDVSEKAERDGGVNDLAEAVEVMIRDDLRRSWTVAELAERNDVSREHLTRIFTRRFGVPPHRYLVEMRVQEARKRLRTTDDPIKQIMLDLGFASHAAFVRVFRRYTHMSPTEYRDAIQHSDSHK